MQGKLSKLVHHSHRKNYLLKKEEIKNLKKKLKKDKSQKTH